MNLGIAIRIAAEGFQHRTDKSGEPYMLHCLRVMNKLHIKEIILDAEGNQHLDVGLKSHLNYITSYETKEDLPRGKEIHWCHPSRFE